MITVNRFVLSSVDDDVRGVYFNRK